MVSKEDLSSKFFVLGINRVEWVSIYDACKSKRYFLPEREGERESGVNMDMEVEKSIKKLFIAMVITGK